MPITDALHRAVSATPDHIATQAGGRTRTFAEQADRIARFAGGLRGLGVVPGDRLAILAMNSDRYLEYLLATSWIGAAFNPLNVRWSTPELVYGLNDAGSRILAVDDAFTATVPGLLQSCPAIEQVIYLGDGECPDGMLAYEDIIRRSDAVEDVHADDGELAGLFYTGGTTGVSRGVMLSHANLLRSALGSLETASILQPGPTLHVAPLFHLAGIWPWLLQLEAGGVHVVQPGFVPEQVISAINEFTVTNIFLVPTMVQRLVEHLAATGAEIPSLRTLQYAGSPMPTVVLDQLQSLLPEVELTQIYGMTELAPVATLLLPADHVGTRRLSAGAAAAHERVRVVDADDRDALPGDIGEIVAQGENVMIGYWKKPEETATTLRNGWMHTGDAGYLDDDGFLYVVDRIKDVIVSGGENVYSVEVENAIMAHPSVANCAVIGREHDQWGESVHAVIVLVPEATLEFDDLRVFTTEKIARYKSPLSMEIVESLPISAAGKILKRELRSQTSKASVTR